MGVADNKTYKDMYHFSNRYFNVNRDELPSIEIDPLINTSIKENPYRSNVEIEKDEIVLKPDLSALFKANGKKHSGGGIDVQLEPDSFIFSDDPELAFDEADHRLFELKKPTSFARLKNTPAEVLKRNIDIKHFNTLVANTMDPKKDDLARKSSIMMLEKYIQTLGNIAYAQEGKKDFPTGIPEFAQGTAPVYDDILKDDIMSQKQYAKYGGQILGQFGPGGPIPSWLKAWRQAKTPQGKTTSTGLSSTYEKTDDQLKQDYEYWKGIAGRDFKDAADYQGFIYDQNLKNDPYSVAEMWSKWGQTNGAGDNPILNINNVYNKAMGKNGLEPNIELLGRQDVRNNFLDRPGNPYLGARTMFLAGKRPTPAGAPAPPITRKDIVTSTPEIPNVPPDTPHPTDITGTPSAGKSIDWQFTPWQKLSQLYSLGKYASARRYMPYRSRLNASYTDPQLVNPEQAIGDLQASANSQIQGLNTLNPIMRNAQAQGMFGQLLDQIPGVRSQYDNQNSQIINQSRQVNNQIANNTRATNMQNDQQYYQQTVVGRQNFDQLRTNLADQYMNNLMQDVQDNSSLAYNEATMKNPAFKFNFRTGNYDRLPVNILDVQGNTSQDTWGATVGELEKLREAGFSDQVISALLRTKAFSQMAPYFGNAPTFGQTRQQKKGGRFNPYK